MTLLLAWAWLAGGFAVLAEDLAGQPEEPSGGGYTLKAAFMYNFAQYVDWPEDKRGSAFLLCVLGSDAMADAAQPLAGKTALNMPVVVRHLRRAADARPCHILFIGALEQPRLSAIVAELMDSGVLTVGDTAGYAEAGVVVNFVERQRKLRFAINPEAARANRLHISSHLLRLAEIVRGASP